MGKITHLHVLKHRSPNTINGKVQVARPPRRVPNREQRTREHLTPAEAERLIAAAGKVGRHGHRDSTLLLLTYRHGLRVAELVALRWEQVDLKQGLLHVSRLKQGVPSPRRARRRGTCRGLPGPEFSPPGP
jgi:integrase